MVNTLLVNSCDAAEDEKLSKPEFTHHVTVCQDNALTLLYLGFRPHLFGFESRHEYLKR